MQRRGVHRRAVLTGGLIALGGAAAAVVGYGAVQAEPAALPRSSPAAPRIPRPTTAPIRRSPVVDVTDWGADRTGRRDSAAALQKALAALPAAGGTVTFPAGRFRLVATKAQPFVTIPDHVVVQGAGAGRTELQLWSDDPAGYREFARPGDDVVLQHLTLRRAGRFPAVLLNVPPVRGFTLLGVTLDGSAAAGDEATCHGLQLAAQPGSTTGLRILDSVIQRCTTCTLITNASTGRLRDVRIERSRLQNIDLNAPLADVAGIRIVDCVVDNTGSDYFGVGLAHVRDVRISGTAISGAAKEAVHIEDHSSGITLSRCRITDSARGAVDAYAYVQIVSGATGVTIDRCVLDARRSTSRSRPYLVAVQAGGEGRTLGGRSVVAPDDVRVIGCTLRADGSAVGVAVYVEGASRVEIEGNRITGDGRVDHGGFSGLADQALLIAEGAGVMVRTNVIEGWRSAIAGANRGGRVRFSGNTVRDCARLVANGAGGRLEVAGNRLDQVLMR